MRAPCSFSRRGSSMRREKILHVDDGTTHPGWDPQGGILHVLGFLAEDGREQLLLGGEFCLAFRRDLTDQNVTAREASTLPHDPALVQVDQTLLCHVRESRA